MKVPVDNTSASWRVHEFKRWRASTIAKGVAEDVGMFARTPQYPSLPEATANGIAAVLDGAAAVPILVDPGDLVVFSAVHLHRSTRNVTSVTRFSIEARTVQRNDFHANVSPVPP